MDQLQITLAQVTQTAASIRSQNQQLNSCLQEIGTSMNQLAAYWQSPASEKIRSRFHGCCRFLTIIGQLSNPMQNSLIRRYLPIKAWRHN